MQPASSDQPRQLREAMPGHTGGPRCTARARTQGERLPLAPPARPPDLLLQTAARAGRKTSEPVGISFSWRTNQTRYSLIRLAVPSFPARLWLLQPARSQLRSRGASSGCSWLHPVRLRQTYLPPGSQPPSWPRPVLLRSAPGWARPGAARVRTLTRVCWQGRAVSYGSWHP